MLESGSKSEKSFQLAVLNLEVHKFTNQESIENRHYKKRRNLNHIWKIKNSEVAYEGMKAYFDEKKATKKSIV